VGTRVVSYNIRFGGGRRIPLIRQLVTRLDPDVLVLQEATDAGAVMQLARDAGLHHVASRPGVSVAALARRPFSRIEWHERANARAILEFRLANLDLRFIGLHLPSGLSRRGEARRYRQLEVVLATVRGDSDDETVLVGDLNSVAHGDEPLVASMPFWLKLLLRLDGRIRTDVLDRLTAEGWVDAYRALHPGEHGFTLPAGSPQIRLDYLLVPSAVLPRVRECAPATDRDLAGRASDHLPLVSVIDD
jgi:exodeoxyribonuclease-3